jgi:hypothetical protein
MYIHAYICIYIQTCNLFIHIHIYVEMQGNTYTLTQTNIRRRRKKFYMECTSHYRHGPGRCTPLQCRSQRDTLCTAQCVCMCWHSWIGIWACVYLLLMSRNRTHYSQGTTRGPFCIHVYMCICICVSVSSDMNALHTCFSQQVSSTQQKLAIHVHT